MTQEPGSPEEVAGTPDALLVGLDDLPLEVHVERFAAVHDVLRARLDGEPKPQAAPDGAQE
ncbi:hypothetical protein LEP48_08680 [Isoptericola sp. NEAU-Y5]|uniref:Uncharacterized protein n=1 Tax=Isoptericola luteus TaxID=2879484 RepID=A0ABS7ZEE9_9MICO|nr:hypothetical protein [Isoptericola sp. NEAU-Y5]MCA5893425.1 hypothetical protein [Isoptericola sp. NEAU-Y5]